MEDRNGSTRPGGECVWGCGAVTPLQVLKTLGDLEVEAVTKPLQSRYRVLQTRLEDGRWKMEVPS
jgi:hypothetical protein